MDLGFEPPLTGYVQFNPWSDFNISGQFVSESWGLIAPGMPQTAGRIGLNYTEVAISGEPAQATQLFDAMIATAFLTSNLERILEAGVAAADPTSPRQNPFKVELPAYGYRLYQVKALGAE
jgi:hypothetical protein